MYPFQYNYGKVLGPEKFTLALFTPNLLTRKGKEERNYALSFIPRSKKLERFLIDRCYSISRDRANWRLNRRAATIMNHDTLKICTGIYKLILESDNAPYLAAFWAVFGPRKLNFHPVLHFTPHRLTWRERRSAITHFPFPLNPKNWGGFWLTDAIPLAEGDRSNVSIEAPPP